MRLGNEGGWIQSGVQSHGGETSSLILESHQSGAFGLEYRRIQDFQIDPLDHGALQPQNQAQAWRLALEWLALCATPGLPGKKGLCSRCTQPLPQSIPNTYHAGLEATSDSLSFPGKKYLNFPLVRLVQWGNQSPSKLGIKVFKGYPLFLGRTWSTCPCHSYSEPPSENHSPNSQVPNRMLPCGHAQEKNAVGVTELGVVWLVPSSEWSSWAPLTFMDSTPLKLLVLVPFWVLPTNRVTFLTQCRKWCLINLAFARPND